MTIQVTGLVKYKPLGYTIDSYFHSIQDSPQVLPQQNDAATAIKNTGAHVLEIASMQLTKLLPKLLFLQIFLLCAKPG